MKDFLKTLFPHKVIKGSSGTDGVMKLFAFRAFYPNIVNISELTKFSYLNNITIRNSVRLSDVEKYGYVLKNPNEKVFLEIKEISPQTQEIKKDYIFDINQTTLPRDLSFFGNIRHFRIDDDFIQQLVLNLKRSTGFEFRFIEEKKIDFDFENKIIYVSKENLTPIKEEDKKKISSIQQENMIVNLISSVVLANLIKNQENYLKVQNNMNIKKRVFVESRFCAVAILSSIGIDKKRDWISPELMKNFIWGKNIDSAERKIKALMQVVAKSVNSLSLHKSVLEHNIKQNYLREKKIIQNAIYSKKSISYEQLSDNQIRELDEKTLNEFIGDEFKIELILDSLGIDYKKHGSNFRLYNLENRGRIKKSPDGVLGFYDNRYVYKNFVNDGKGTIIDFVAQIQGIEWKDAKKYCIDVSNSRDYFIEAIEDIRNRVNEQSSVLSNLDRYIQKLINDYKDVIDENDYYEIVQSKDAHFLASKKIDLEQKIKIVDNKEIEIKEINSNFKQDVVNNRSSIVKYIDIDCNLAGNSTAEKYLRDYRGYKKIPSFVKEFTGRYVDKNGKNHFVNGVGILNNSNGADLKIIDDFRYGKAQSFGSKDFTLINTEILTKGVKTPERIFCVFESQWDMIAAYQDKEFQKILDRSVNIVLNGASNAINRAIGLINDNKVKNTRVFIFDQGDDVSTKTMTDIEFNIVGMSHGKDGFSNTTVYRLKYTEEQLKEKMDLNDLLKEYNEKNVQFDGAVMKHFSNPIEVVNIAESDVYPKVKQ